MSFFCIPEEGQRICVAAFPIIKIWLQQISLPHTEIFQPICSFIAMTVANNCKFKEWNCLCQTCDFLCLFKYYLNDTEMQTNLIITSYLFLQPVFRKVFLPMGVWKLSLLHWFV